MASYEELLVDVLRELDKTNAFDYPTVLEQRRSAVYYLIELIPKIENRLLLPNKHRRVGRAAIQLSSERFTVFQPRWLVPLQDELEAISSILPEHPAVSTDYVDAWMLPAGGVSDISIGGPVAEVKSAVDEARIQYWTTRAEKISAQDKTELPKDE